MRALLHDDVLKLHNIGLSTSCVSVVQVGTAGDARDDAIAARAMYILLESQPQVNASLVGNSILSPPSMLCIHVMPL